MSYRGYLWWALWHKPAWGLRLLWVEIQSALELWQLKRLSRRRA